jgi:hypothetical protein
LEGINCINHLLPLLAYVYFQLVTQRCQNNPSDVSCMYMCPTPNPCFMVD